MDGGPLRTFLCDPMHTLRSSGYTLSGIYIDDLSWSPRTNLPENAFLQPSFDVINIPIKDTDISSNLINLITFSGKFQLGDQFFSVIYTIPHTNPWVSAGVHTLAKKVVLAAFLVVIHQTIALYTGSARGSARIPSRARAEPSV